MLFHCFSSGSFSQDLGIRLSSRILFKWMEWCNKFGSLNRRNARSYCNPALVSRNGVLSVFYDLEMFKYGADMKTWFHLPSRLAKNCSLHSFWSGCSLTNTHYRINTYNENSEYRNKSALDTSRSIRSTLIWRNNLLCLEYRLISSQLNKDFCTDATPYSYAAS